MVFGKVVFHIQKKKKKMLEPFLRLNFKKKYNESKFFPLNGKTIKFLEENIGKKFPSVGFGLVFIGRKSKAYATKVKIDWSISKFKNTSKNNITRVFEKTSCRLGEICANHLVDKRLISRIYKELLHLNT